MYLLTMTGSIDDMPIGLYPTAAAALQVAVAVGWQPCEPVPAARPGDAAGDPYMQVRGATIVWGMGPSEPQGYKISKFNSDGYLIGVAIFTYDDGCPDFDADEGEPRPDAIRDWCRTNWTLEPGF